MMMDRSLVRSGREREHLWYSTVLYVLYTITYVDVYKVE